MRRLRPEVAMAEHDSPAHLTPCSRVLLAIVMPLLRVLRAAAAAVASPPRPCLLPVHHVARRRVVSSGEEYGRCRTSWQCSSRPWPLALAGAIAHDVTAVSPSLTPDLRLASCTPGEHSTNAEAGRCGLVAPGRVAAAAGALCGPARRRAARQSARCASAAISGLLKALHGLCAAFQTRAQTLQATAVHHRAAHARTHALAPSASACSRVRTRPCAKVPRRMCCCVVHDSVHGVPTA